MAETQAPRRFYRSRTDRKLAGVCGGIAEYFGWDATLVRILWVIATFASIGLGVVAYLVFWIAAPERP